jgi:hypothetical protein
VAECAFLDGGNSELSAVHAATDSNPDVLGPTEPGCGIVTLCVLLGPVAPDTRQPNS